MLSTPVIRGLRQGYPKAQIDYLSTKGPGEALSGNPHLDSLFTIEDSALKYLPVLLRLRAGFYDAVFVLQSSPRTIPFILAARSRQKVGFRKRGMRDVIYEKIVAGQKDDCYVPRKFSRLITAADFPAPSHYGLDLAISEANRS